MTALDTRTVLPSPHEALPHRCAEVAIGLYAAGVDPAEVSRADAPRLVSEGIRKLGGRAAVAAAAKAWAGYNTMRNHDQLSDGDYDLLMGKKWPDRARLDACLEVAYDL